MKYNLKLFWVYFEQRREDEWVLGFEKEIREMMETAKPIDELPLSLKLMAQTRIQTLKEILGE